MWAQINGVHNNKKILPNIAQYQLMYIHAFLSQAIVMNHNNFFVWNLINEAQLHDERGDRIFHERLNPFELPDRQFVKLFRLTKQTTEALIDVMNEHIPDATRESALDVTTKTLTALKFFSAGSYQPDTGHNVYTAVSQSSVSRSIKQVVKVLNRREIMDRWIRFPRNIQEMHQIRDKFWEKYQFPNVVGCIDCTHVAIFPPSANDPNYPEHIYVNRKGYHSINVQLICDADYRIINVNARYPGSTHDSFIWNHSDVLPIMRGNYERNRRLFLIGDSGYALRPWLMTPVLHALEGSPEEYFSNRLTTVRSLIERVNGILKMRFRCLLKHRVLHYSPQFSSEIINACCVLHNMCIEYNVPEPEAEEQDPNIDFGLAGPEDNVPENIHNNLDLQAGRQMRNRIVQYLWNRRHLRM